MDAHTAHSDPIDRRRNGHTFLACRRWDCTNNFAPVAPIVPSLADYDESYWSTTRTVKGPPTMKDG
jgi:hypothetical protein